MNSQKTDSGNHPPDDISQDDQFIEIESDDNDNESLGIPKSAFSPINFSSGGRRIIDLYRAYKEDKELDPRPSFQRGYVWDRNRATKLIESILLHVPLPLVYTAEEETGLEVVIDGQQRLTTCFAFIDGYFPLSKKDEERKKKGDQIRNKPFKLGKMKITSHLENKTYNELDPELKKTINNYNIQVIKISKDSHPEVKFEIFERLNTGSVSLADQEIRNCIYRGPYNDLLYDLAQLPKFQTILGISDTAVRMQDVELVLRFMAFNESTHLNYDNKMRKFLNDHMRNNRHINNEKKEQYRRDFTNAVNNSFTVFGEKAFRRYSDGNFSDRTGKWEKAINKAVYDVLMFWFARYDQKDIVTVKDAIREEFINLCVTDKEFIDAITLGTADPGRVKIRFKKWEAVMDSIVKTDKNLRAFTYEQKIAAFQQNRSCYICNQQISHIDDAEMDHVIPYSKGGLTNSENGRISHRYCNRSKGSRVLDNES